MSCRSSNLKQLLAYKQVVFNYLIQKNRIQSTWNGDPGKFPILYEILKVIEDENLILNAKETGKVFLRGLMELQVITIIRFNLRESRLVIKYQWGLYIQKILLTLVCVQSFDIIPVVLINPFPPRGSPLTSKIVWHQTK